MDIYIHLWQKVAGFRQRPRSVYDVAESGFRTDKITLNKIAAEAEVSSKNLLMQL